MLAGGAALHGGGPGIGHNGEAPAAGTTRRSSSTRWAASAIPMAPRTQLRLSDRAWAEMVATGVTVLRDTVMPVGNLRRPVGRLSEGHRPQAEHHQRQSRPAAAGPQRRRHPQGQAREEVRGRHRHPGHVDGRARARPAGADEEGRGDDRPADLQQPQPRRRRRAGAGQCRPVEAGQGDDRADRGGKTAARPVARRRADDGRGGGLRQAAAGRSATPARGRSPTIRATPTTRRSRRSPTRAAWSASISCPS